MTARERLPNRRQCESFEFRHAGLDFTLADWKKHFQLDKPAPWHCACSRRARNISAARKIMGAPRRRYSRSTEGRPDETQ
jgi:hypothetical protein